MYLVVRASDKTVVSAWWSRQQAEDAMRQCGFAASNCGIEAHAVGHPGVHVDAQERVERLLRDDGRNDEDQNANH